MSRLFTAAVATAALGLVGCAGPLPSDPATSGDHPANPNAPTAAFPLPSQTLAVADAPSEPLPPSGHQHAGTGDDDAPASLPGEAGMDHAAMGHDMASMSRPTTKPSSQPTTQAAAIYTCPMHPEVRADAPGRCPICGMKLVEREGGAE